MPSYRHDRRNSQPVWTRPIRANPQYRQTPTRSERRKSETGGTHAVEFDREAVYRPDLIAG